MLRPPVPSDEAAITAVTLAGFETYRAFAGDDWSPPTDMVDAGVTQRLQRPGGWGVVATDDGAVVGFGAFEPARDGPDGPLIDGLAHVWAVFAAPSHWGTGVAAEILGALTAEMARGGFPEARLFTPAGQTRARRFYAREGWTEHGEPIWVEALGLDVVELRRPL